MGQKIHPGGFRVGYIHDWKSNWFDEKNFADVLSEDLEIRDHIVGKLSHAGLSDITIERRGEVTVDIHTARPGIVIGKSGSEVDALRKDLHKLTGKPVKVNIREVKRPELDAKLVAQSIAEQLQNRVAFRRAMKRALTSAMRSGAKGVEGPGLRSPRRRRDGAHRRLFRRPRAAAHAAREHRLRLLRGEDDRRPDRRQMLDQQGRGHAQGLPDRPGRGRRAAGRRTSRRRPSRRRTAPGRRTSRRPRRPARGRSVADADAEAGQAPQTDARTDARQHQGRQHGRLRRVRAEVARPRLDHQPPDRGRPRRDDPQDQTWRQGLDQRLPRQAVHEEARRDPDGLGKGQPRGLGRRGQAGQGHVRAGRRPRGPRQGGAAPRRAQASRCGPSSSPARGPSPDEGQRGPQHERRRARGEVDRSQAGGIQPALPPRHGRAREHCRYRRLTARRGKTVDGRARARHRRGKRAEDR